MPVQSKIAGPYLDDDDVSLGFGRQNIWSSPHLPSDTFRDNRSDLSYSLDGVPNFYTHGSRLSGSVSGSVSGSIGNGGGIGSRSVSNPRSASSHSHITIPSASPVPEYGLGAEVMSLRGENESLKQENVLLKQQVQRLRGQVEALSYVNCPSRHTRANYSPSIRDSYGRLVEGLSDRVDETRKGVQSLIQTLSTKFVGPIPGIKQKRDIPLNPTREDFPSVHYWHQEPWSAQRKSVVKNSEQDFRTYSAFMEDEFGNAIPETTRRSIRSDFSSYFTELFKKGEIPKGFWETNLSEKESHRIAMESRYPWLRLCDGNWKFRQVWTHSLSRWRATKLPKLSKETADDDREIIEVSSEEDDRRRPRVVLEPPTSDSSGGVKRKHDGKPGVDAPKKQKTTESARSFHPARPKSKGKQPAVKFAIVSIASYAHSMRILIGIT